MDDETLILIAHLNKEAEALRAECERSLKVIRESWELLDAITDRLSKSAITLVPTNISGIGL